MVDSIKGGAVDGMKEAAKAAAKAAAEAIAKAAAAAQAAAAAKAASEAAAPKSPGEGFDDAKKKPMSVSGRYKPPANTAISDPQLQDEVSSARLMAQSGSTSTTKPVAMTTGPSGVNTIDGPKPSAAGKISKEEWDNPQKLLGKLTQNPASGATVNSGHRCGPSALMGAAIMQGPDSTAKYLTNVADAPKNNRLSDAEKTELKGIAEKVKNKEATFEDMGRAQDLTYKSGNRVRDVGSTIQEALAPPQNANLSGAEQTELKGLITAKGTPENMQRVGELVTKASGHPSRVVKDPDAPGAYLMTVEGSRSANDTSAYTDREVAELAEIGGTKLSSEPMTNETVKGIFKDLKPGESAVLRVSAHPPLASDTEVRPANHFVTIGKRKDGTAFIYNSDPSLRDPTLFVGGKGDKQNAAFMKELAKYEERTGIDPNGHQPKVTKLKID